jgi:formamidopyrimidine-DNA glycosylase
MPELAEVFYYARQWDAGRSKPVLRIDLHGKKRVFRGCDVRALEDRMIGAKLLRSHTHGKQMLFEFSRGCWLGVHLGMTGDLSAKPEPFDAGRHDHLVLHLRDRALVFTDPRQFGRIQFHHGKDLPEAWSALPPQPMDRKFTVTRLQDILRRHGGQPLKSLLLDQRYFPGIGNWMADEVLWQARLHPKTSPRSLDSGEAKALHRALRKVCTVSLKTIGTDWGDPPRSWLFRHRWSKGHACPRCGTALVRRDIRGRTSCWCPQCQPEPSGA